MLRWINQSLNKTPVHTKEEPEIQIEDTSSDLLPNSLASRILDL